jgi:hypothetical protein
VAGADILSGTGRRRESRGPESSGYAAKERNLIWNHRLPGRLLLAVSLLLLPAAAGAQELYTYTVGLFGGIGGSPDADPGGSFTNTGFQVNLGLVTEPHTHLVLRTGRLGLDKDQLFGSLSNADMEYVTLGGEYRYSEEFYESGVFVALGGYRLNGTQASGRDSQRDSWGVSVGFTGELPIRRWLGVQAELSGHYVDFKEEQFFAMAHVGLAFHF